MIQPILLSLVAAALPLAAMAGTARNPKPNIVIILADDLGYGDAHCYNPERGKIATPHFDRLAAQGMRFTDGHSSSGVCSPSRYTLLTGRYHWRTGTASIVTTYGPPMIAPDRLTVASLLRGQGYRTAAIGKWHLGWNWPIPADKAGMFVGTPSQEEIEPSDTQKAAWREVFTQPIPSGPTSRGFDSYFGTDVPNWPPYCFIENNRTVGVPSSFLPPRLLTNHQASKQGPALPDWKLESILPALGDRACAFITSAATKGAPFFLYLPLTAPHTPLAVNAQWAGKSGLITYADFVMETDALVGRVLEALDKSGASANTLLVFTSDNGCAPYIGAPDLEKRGHYPSGPLRGYKADVWEGGHRVPFIVRWPGIVAPGSVSDQLVQQADLLATIAEVLGVSLPENAGEDSFSFLPLLKGGSKATRRHAVNQSTRGLLALRDGPWKLIFGAGSGSPSPGGDTYPGQLYNLADDIGEANNLFSAQPDVVARLTRLMKKIVEDGRSTPGLAQANDQPLKWKISFESGKKNPPRQAAPKQAGGKQR